MGKDAGEEVVVVLGHGLQIVGFGFGFGFGWSVGLFDGKREGGGCEGEGTFVREREEG